MSKFVLMLLAAAFILAAAGCKSSSGSREYIPGRGWVNTD